MPPSKPIPYPDDFSSEDEYVDSLLHFASTSTIFQTLCGGVHILDFFTREPSLYHKVIPPEWQEWLLSCPSSTLLDLLMRDDLSLSRADHPPASLLTYIRSIRMHSLIRSVPPSRAKPRSLPRNIAVGMVPKKIHEVANFADYVVQVADEVAAERGSPITHFVDFGSGQNYLGRALASPPYQRNIVAVESKGGNISGARNMDVLAGVAEREKVMRNKKMFREREARERGVNGEEKSTTDERGAKKEEDNQREKEQEQEEEQAPKKPKQPRPDIQYDTRPTKSLATIYTPSSGKGNIQYVEHRLENGDLSSVVSQIQNLQLSASDSSVPTPAPEPSPSLMAISIHSCGNLSHHGIRSLLLNPSVHAIAIVGCCYNLLTESISPPCTHTQSTSPSPNSTPKHPLLRPNLRAINLPSPSLPTHPDPHGYPMSTRLRTHNKTGIPLNITARMMGVQAPANWASKESEDFFTRHYFRALLQRLFLDYGVVERVALFDGEEGEGEEKEYTTTPIIIGSLRKSAYTSFTSYVRGAISKLTLPSTSPHPDIRHSVSSLIQTQLGSITDEEIKGYEQRYGHKKQELSVVWSLMAFSAGVVESLVVVDRWEFLREAVRRGEVRRAWVEGVFEYGVSPRNLVVVGVK
ncbi:Methyltransferase 25 protein [Rutstroemia sp. NJR-2017a WRK4]|nr:Methyltransferase 25 protein [Rutstroemia sp. NJR-2017a WRK4]